MKTTSSRLFWFSIGLLLGFTMALAIFLSLSSGIKHYPLINKLTARDTVIDKRIIQKTEEKPEPKIRKKSESSPLALDNLDEFNKFVLPSSDDTFRKDIATANGATLVVKKDELIKIVYIRLKDLDTNQVKKSTDSLLEIFERGLASGDKLIFIVEFWRSPVNYTGYRMIRNKLVTFGLDSNEEIELIRFNGRIFLKQKQNIYALKQTSEFDSFKPVSEDLKTRILAKING